MESIDDPDLVQALDYIRSNACRGIKVYDVAAHVAVSRRSLESRFRRAVGRSPADEIRRFQVAKACKLLAETELSLVAVAQQSGLRRRERLSNMMRRYCGSSPSAYRDAQQVAVTD